MAENSSWFLCQWVPFVLYLRQNVTLLHAVNWLQCVPKAMHGCKTKSRLQKNWTRWLLLSQQVYPCAIASFSSFFISKWNFNFEPFQTPCLPISIKFLLQLSADFLKWNHLQTNGRVIRHGLWLPELCSITCSHVGNTWWAAAHCLAVV